MIWKMRHDLSIALTIPNTSPIMAIIPILVPTQRVTAIKLSFVGAGRARDEGATSLQSLCKCRGHGPLLRRSSFPRAALVFIHKSVQDGT